MWQLETACGSHKGKRQKPARCGFPSALALPGADGAHITFRHSQMLSNWWIISNRQENQKNMLKTNNQLRTLVRKLRFHWKNWATETPLKVSFISWVLPVMERIMKSTPYFFAIFTLVSSTCPSSRSSKASLFCHHSTGGSPLEKFQILLKPTCSSKATLQIEEPALVSRCREFTCTESKFTASVSHAPSSHADSVSITWVMTSAPKRVIAMVFCTRFQTLSRERSQHRKRMKKRQGIPFENHSVRNVTSQATIRLLQHFCWRLTNEHVLTRIPELFGVAIATNPRIPWWASNSWSSQFWV